VFAYRTKISAKRLSLAFGFCRCSLDRTSISFLTFIMTPRRAFMPVALVTKIVSMAVMTSAILALFARILSLSTAWSFFLCLPLSTSSTGNTSGTTYSFISAGRSARRSQMRSTTSRGCKWRRGGVSLSSEGWIFRNLRVMLKQHTML
jgi:hypothetical protein